MKFRLLATTTILALGTSTGFAADVDYGTSDPYAPPPASFGPSGPFGDARLMATYFGSENFDDDWSVLLDGAIVLPFGNGWNVGVTAGTEYFFEADEWQAGATSHLFYANAAWAVGAFAAVDDEEAYAVGGEAAAFMGNLDLLALLSYTFADIDSVGVSVAANVWFDPETVLAGGVGSVWFDGGGDVQFADVLLERRFGGTPFTGFVSAGWDNSGGDNYALRVGTRVLFGNVGSLQDHYRASPFTAN